MSVLEMLAYRRFFRTLSAILRTWHSLVRDSQVVGLHVKSCNRQVLTRTLVAWFMTAARAPSSSDVESSMDEAVVMSLGHPLNSSSGVEDHTEILLHSLLLSYRRLEAERSRRRVLSSWANLSGAKAVRG